MRSTRLSLAILVVFALLGAAQAIATKPADEPFFSRAGNEGYNALHYEVRLAYRPKGGGIRAATEVDAMATKSLKSFSFEGWFRTDDGVIAVGEPQGTAAWIPCDNVPTDKATFEFQITVPDGLKAVANGRRTRSANRSNRVQMNWVEAAPMSTYLAVLPEAIRFEAGIFGAYPFDSAGSLVDYAPSLGYALESQSRPIYAYVPDVTTIVHETAHQWFGDSVGLERWPQIWLNEGFATWAQWYYAERHGGRTAHAIFKRLNRVPASDGRFWNPPPAILGRAKDLFDPTTYVRGAMALQALREKIGTEPMLRLLHRWTSAHRHGNATIGQFTDLAEEVSGRGLDPLFQRWLYQRGKPHTGG
ncbi:MAG: hypothetical protein QOF06_1712 [Solirubrobacterales bacterium]|nr:hypothetical protein [Solirubrobacterales bacterium]